MNVTDILGINGITQLLPMLYTDLAQPSVKKVGQALETVFEFSTTPLLLMKLVNETVKLNLKHHLDNYRKKLDSIPDDNIHQVNPQIGVPILEYLTFVTDEEIADLFTTLLLKASNKKTLNQAHPSFVQLISRLSVDEAQIIKYLQNKENIPCVTVKGIQKVNGNIIQVNTEYFNIIADRITILPSKIILYSNDNINAYFDNFISMGIIEYVTDRFIVPCPEYQEIIEKNNFDKLEENEMFSRYEYVKTFFNITDFGKLFIKACNLQDFKKR
jgi:hypothetical protein